MMNDHLEDMVRDVGEENFRSSFIWYFEVRFRRTNVPM